MTGADRVVIGGLAVAILGGALLIDPRAEASFDAPKRLAALAGIAVAAGAGFAVRRPSPSASKSPAARLALALAAVALAGGLVAAAASPRPRIALDAARTALLYALLLPLGASRAVEGRRVVVGLFLGAAAVNALLSVLQASRVFQPFAFETVAGRAATGALVGNEGVLALELALAVVATVAVVLTAAPSPARRAAAACLPLLLAGLVVNRSLTALMTAGTGVLVLGAATYGRRAIVPAVVAAAALAAIVVASPPFRARLGELARHVRAGEWDDATSNRLGPWAAALEMARARPLLGVGPGGFGGEFVPSRLRAEIRFRARFVIPRLTSSYGEAHCEYLQVIAEAGMPAGLAAIGAAATLLLALARKRGRWEERCLLAFLLAAAVGALTWFPLQRPVSAVPILLAAGRAWRLLG